MQLGEIIEIVDREADGLCIVAKKPWTAVSEAQMVRLTDDFRVPAQAVEQGYDYFLEVSVALDEVLAGVEQVLTKEQRFNAVLYYAENGAYPEWLCAIRGSSSA